MRSISEANALDFNLQWLLNEGQDLFELLNSNNAVYHHTCKSKYNEHMLSRQNKIETELSSPPPKRRSMIQNFTLDTKRSFCYFCKESDDQVNLRAAGTFHATKTKANMKHVDHLTTNWLKMARVLNDDELIKLLSSGDVCLNEVFYHKENVKCCLQKFNKMYLQKVKESSSEEQNVLTKS